MWQKQDGMPSLEEEEGRKKHEFAQALVLLSLHALAPMKSREEAGRQAFHGRGRSGLEGSIPRFTQQLVCSFLFLLFHHSLASISVDHISPGFSASPMGLLQEGGNFLRSQNGNFFLGLLSIDGDGIYYLCLSHRSNVTVWVANRDNPAQYSDTFVFSEDGDAALIGADGSKIWSTHTENLDVRRMQLQEDGNLVLLNGGNQTVWESFDHPTDTLLSGQILRPGMKLVSSLPSSMSSGLYFLSMQSGNLILSVNFSPPQTYWNMAQNPTTVRLSSGTPAFARLDGSGLSLVDANSTVVFQISSRDDILATPARAYLDPDGNFHLFSLADVWTEYFTAVVSTCALPLSCGPYGICSGSGQCSCPGWMQPLNRSDLSQGCQAYDALSPCSYAPDVKFQQIGAGLDYFANPFTEHEMASSVDACQQRCQQNCSCTAFFYFQKSNLCFLFSQVGTLQQLGNKHHFSYMKLEVHPEVEPLVSIPPSSKGAPKFLIPVIIGSVCVVTTVISCIACRFYFLRRKSTSSEDDLETIVGLPARFSYKELVIATNKFSKKLGSGGFGSVYEGVLPDKCKVAVKQLESVGQGKEEFRSEVAIIGSIHHIHLVHLRGFCVEGMHRLLVYEFMANGSLDKCLFVDPQEGIILDWNRRYNIALGMARGLAYLHDDCRERIIHCDIKPENILLDENYVAKVSDFGLAKLVNKEQSQVLTSVRGTRGYFAPEWLTNLRLSEKSDVYSFGMVLLEIISGRRNFDLTESSEKWYFPAYAFKQAENGKLEALVDAKLKETAVTEQVVRVVRVALWCIQEEAHVRPSMGKVVQMLEGNVEAADPPLTSCFAVRLHARMIEAMCLEETVFATGHDSGTLSAIQISVPR